MHELDDANLFSRIVAALEATLKVEGIHKVGVGNECCILRANLPDGPVVIKVPKDKVFSNVNDAYIDSRALLAQEFALMRHVKASGVARVPNPMREVDVEGYGVLIMSYVEDDASAPDQYKLGRLLARIHSIAVPSMELSAQEGSEVPELIAGRLRTRWAALAGFVEELPELPGRDILIGGLEFIRTVKRLLHMDFRRANFRMRDGEVLALLDWSNALIGHPALELARVAETGENGTEFLRGYASVATLPDVDPLTEVIFRLDTATMLALVFLSEDPDPERSPAAVDRVIELHKELAVRLANDS